MISKRVFISAAHDNYARLAAYIADTGPANEKCLMHWCAGMLGGDDYQEGIAESVDAQKLNTRAATKTYHLVISFRPEDEAKLTPDTFKAIEERFAAALGYTEHQRHCGVHKNTANLHMHIAYNTIHPERHTHHKEFRDYWIRDKLCRELEKEYGLGADNGRKKEAQQLLGEKAALIEAHTGQQSFEAYARSHRDNILYVLTTATDWQTLHEGVALYGMTMKPHGNGLALVSRHNQWHSVKVSAVDRTVSLQKLEAILGPYSAPRNVKILPEQTRYEAAPLHRSLERGALYAEYQQGIEQRKSSLAAVKEHEDAALTAIRDKWKAKRVALEKLNIAKRNRRNLLQVARRHEAEEIASAKLLFQAPRKAVREKVPYTSWNAFLQHKAQQGHEVALAILRSIKERVEVERDTLPAQGKDWSAHDQEQFSGWRNEVRAEYAAKELDVLDNVALTGKGKTRLLAVLRMEQLAQEELRANTRATGHGQEAGQAPLIAGFTHTVDRRGVVMFTLPGGGTIRDTGKELFFSAHDAAAKAVALDYARKKWGKAVHLEGNRLCRKMKREKQRSMER